jgi:hypothetical protein
MEFYIAVPSCELPLFVFKRCAVYLICAPSDPGYEAVHPPAATQPCPAPAPDGGVE